MVDEPVLERWVRLEANRMNEAVVTQPRLLADALREPEPRAPGRTTGGHRFDPAALRRLSDALGALTRTNLRVPITFFLDHEVPGDCYAMGDDAFDALHELRVAAGHARYGRLWVSRPLALDLAARFPTCVQFVRV